MPLRTTLVLAVLGALLGSGYYVYEIRGRAARDAASAAEHRVLEFDPAAVREVTIVKRGERVVVRADGARWQITEPEPGVADAQTVQGLLAFVHRLEKVRALDGAMPALATYGLAEPAVRLRFRLRDGAPLTLRLGDPNPAATGVYAHVDGAAGIFLAPIALARELSKTPYVDEIRDKTVFPMEPERVRRLEIERAGARIVVIRVDERHWRVERPFRAPGDDGIIRDLLWKISVTRSRSVIRPPGSLRAYGLDRPHARVRVVDDARAIRTLTVTLNDADARELYATADGSPDVRVIDAQLLSDLALEPTVLRDRQLLVHDARQVERITIRYPAQTLALERAGDRWLVTQPVTGEAARPLIDNLFEVLPNLRYTAVAAAAVRDLGRYGLDRPRWVVTVGMRGGRVLPALSVGDAQGGMHFVMVAGKPAVYKVDSRLFRVIPDDPADAKRYPLPEQLTRRAR
jgi:hypothetical protein